MKKKNDLNSNYMDYPYVSSLKSEKNSLSPKFSSSYEKKNPEFEITFKNEKNNYQNNKSMKTFTIII